MQGLISKTENRRKTVKERYLGEEHSLSPEILTPKCPFYTTTPEDYSFQDSVSIKGRLKLELKSFRESPQKDYSARLQSILNNVSPRETPNSTFHMSPRSKDSNSQFSERETICASPKNIVLQPICTLVNRVSRAGFKTRGISLYAGRKFHASSIIIKANFQNTKGKYLFSMVEGNGPFGSKCSKLVKNIYPGVLELNLKLDSRPEKIYSALNSIDDKLLELLKKNDQDVHFSGCSILSILVHGESVYVSNLGNCQAVLAKYNKEQWEAQALSNPHDLTNISERSRITELGGRLLTENLNENSNLLIDKFLIGQNKGLSFETTRAIGNVTGKIVGISSKPEIFKFEIKNEEKFVIIANSNFWRVISHDYAVQLATEGWIQKKTDVCCEKLINEAESRLNLIGDTRNEVSVIIFFINS